MISQTAKEQIGKGSLIRKMFEEGKRLQGLYGAENVYDFSLGNPDLEPPAAVLEALREDAASALPGLHGYMANSGYEEARQKVADFEGKRAGLKLESKACVMTVGAAGALSVILQSLCDKDDEVMVIRPYFTEYTQYTRLAGARLVEVSCGEDFEPDLSDLASKITARTKAVILNSPNNPSGAVYSAEVLKKLASLLEGQDHTIYVISDEPYREIVYGETEVPSVLAIFRNAIVAYSWSKSYALPGERIGYLCFSPRLDDYEDLCQAVVLYNRILGFVNAPAIWQRVVTKCIGLKTDVSIYQRRRDMLLDIFKESGISCRKPEGAFYLFPAVPEGISEKDFTDLLARHHILVVPGSAFGMPGHVRISYAVKDSVIARSRAAFREAMKELRNLA